MIDEGIEGDQQHLYQEREDFSIENENQAFWKRVEDIKRITDQYDTVQKEVEVNRAEHEQQLVDQMTDLYLTNFQQTAQILGNKKNQEVQERRKVLRPPINVGSENREESKFIISEQQEKLYRPPI